MLGAFGTIAVCSGRVVGRSVNKRGRSPTAVPSVISEPPRR